MSELLSRRDLRDQVAWIEFEWEDGAGSYSRRLTFPVSIFKPIDDGETWRILDQHGVVHVFPAPGRLGCVITYEKARGADDPAEL